MTKQALKNYKRTEVLTSDKGRLILVLYEGAINFLQEAKKAIAKDDKMQKGILITKAMNIISELNMSLNMEVGGELAFNLRKLYLFMQNQLIDANIRLDIRKIDEVLVILNNLLDGWREAVENTSTQEAPNRATQVGDTKRVGISA